MPSKRVIVTIPADSPVWEAFDRFEKYVEKQTDPVMMLLRAHLYSEAALENIIRIRLPHGEVVLHRDADLSYRQKLLLVQALDVVDSPTINALKALNKIRNDFAHQLDKELTSQDVLRIGSHLRKQYERYRRESGSDTVETLKRLLTYLCVSLEHTLHSLKDSKALMTFKES